MAVSSNYTTACALHRYYKCKSERLNGADVKSVLLNRRQRWHRFRGADWFERETRWVHWFSFFVDFFFSLHMLYVTTTYVWSNKENVKKKENDEKRRLQTIWCHTHLLSFLQAQRATVAATGRWLDSWMSLLANWGVLSSSSRLVSSRHGSVNTRHSGGWTAAGTGSYLYKQQLTGLLKKKTNTCLLIQLISILHFFPR